MIEIIIRIDNKNLLKQSKRIVKAVKKLAFKKVSPIWLVLFLTLASILIIGVNLVLAWTDPTANPPSDNVPAPINVGSTTQTKSGTLILGKGLQLTSGWPGNPYGEAVVANSGGHLYLGPDSNASQLILFRYNNDNRVRFSLNGGTNNSAEPNIRTNGSYLVISPKDGDYLYLGLDNPSGRVYIQPVLYTDFIYDRNNTSYYLDPAGSSNFDTICIRGDCRSSWPAAGADDDWTISSNYVKANRWTVYGDRFLINGKNTGMYNDGHIWADGNIRSEASIVAGYNVKAENNLVADNSLRIYNDARIDGRILGVQTIEAQSYIYSQGDIKAEGAIYADKFIKAGGNIDTSGSLTAKGNVSVEGRIVGKLARQSCYWTTSEKCGDGEYVAGAKYTGGIHRIFCCGSSGSSSGGGGGPSDPPDPVPTY
ncbi:hypothetical protein DRN98_10060 [Methanosarcinales archaeon]|nr:MAG: hypothetical protein DRN98_10060 [Methanosarcinales archaeon]